MAEPVTWSPARRLDRSGPWGWTFWRTELDLTPRNHQVAVRAVDASGTTQPEHAAPLWNFKGYANNSRHRINITASRS